ncbi:MAG: hypothetical protein A4S09_03515 [Proteobacteria bacterium SG_bin7]|nr:MAG: hypothetical protein A4S09_03515 [Proteobacteria bacterium SG_bin7]
MKKLAMIGLAVLGMSFESYADPAFPRDLKCMTASGEVTLQSNNGFWSYAQNGRYNVQLLVTQRGQTETLSVLSVNNVAQRVRGNDVGLRQYVFASKDGKQVVSLALEFNAPYGLATSIKTFLGTANTGEVLVDANRDSCEVIFYPRIEI